MTGRRILALFIVGMVAAVAAGCGSSEANPTAPTSGGGGDAAGTGSPGGCALPARPTDLRVTSMVGTLVELSWSPVTGASSYTVLVGSTPGATDILSSGTAQPSLRFTARDGRQFARVQAHSACGAGPSTGSIEFTVRP